MAYEADRVVVSLVADNSEFDTNVRQSTQSYQQGMSQISAAASGAEKAHGRMTLAANNNRIAMLELQHVVRGSADQFAAGAPVTQIFAQHIASIGEAAALAGSSLGKVGAFLSGPWGLALSAATALVVTLISKHKDEADTLDSVYDKLKKHKEQTALNAEANNIWAHSIDGVIESEKALADQLEKTLQIQSVVQRQAFGNAQTTVAERGRQLQQAESQFNEGDPRLTKAREAFHQAVRDLNALQTQVDEAQGAALSDLTKRSQEWADTAQNNIRYIEGIHPELKAFGSDISAAFEAMKKAVDDASAAGINVGAATGKFEALNAKLKESPAFINEYIKDVRALAREIENFTTTASNAPKAIDDFKRSVIGAEGTGQNRLGSHAAGYGQFMPSTFEGYFRQLYPQQAAGMSTTQIDEMRNNRQVAEAVIDAATQDYVTVLKAAGQQITAAALYTVHLLGTGDARKFFAASPDQSVRSALGGGRHADAVIAGNPFLGGSVADAQSAIASRIGGSSGAASAGAVALQHALDEQLATRERINLRLQDEHNAQKKVTVEVQKQTTLHGKSLETLLAEIDGATGLSDALKKVSDDMKLASDFGGQLVDDVLNPDNWTSWGNIGKTVLHDLEREFLTLAAINPLKNLLFGSQLPTLNNLFSGFGSLFGVGGGGGAASGVNIGGGTSSFFSSHPFGFASGGHVRGAGTSTSDSIPALLSDGEYVLNETAVRRIGVSALDALNGGKVRLFAEGGLVRRVSPTNASAVPPSRSSGSDGGDIYINVDARDAVLAQTVQQWIAAGMAQAANGGSLLARRNLGRESMHRLE